ncbi:hypothetical protein J437_LFUL017119 [Ladona fulva]|uniref:DUF5641 domain-containing protein n=1 Tax=Ladona fulva TaxID=123851 RepID=A0A8K0KNG5_LADFU|nr:hypothetical protein J437_LFUL017119 [Ladona fulva]
MPIEEFQLNTVTYGLTTSPFLAMQVLQQLSEDEALNFPLAASIVPRDFFVDDLVSGASSPDLAKRLVKELISLLKAGGFQLHKWSSNLPEVLEGITLDERQLCVNFDPEGETCQNTLNNVAHVSTKRGILSEIAKIYDPLGYISPVHFWRRWSDEYLTTLQARPKWRTAQPNLIVCDLVVLKGEKSGPQNWPIARVHAVHPGGDGNVRVVTIRTNHGFFRRPVLKVVKLPTDA